MLSGKSTSPISQREKNKVVTLLNGGAVANPINVIAQLLNEHFGWSLNVGKIRAKAIIGLLLKEKVIEADHNSRGLKSISLMRTQASEEPLNPRLVKPKTTLPPPEPEVQVVVAKRRYRPSKKGEAKARRQRELVGEKAERRLHELSLKLALVLKNRYREFVTEISVSRSGHNNPKKRKIDLQDSAGEDITILVTLCDQGRFRTGRIIYDAKNSRLSAVKFNNNIYLYPGQENALLKKAVSTNKIRSDREIMEEILQDMVSVQLFPAHYKEEVVSLFSDIA